MTGLEPISRDHESRMLPLQYTPKIKQKIPSIGIEPITRRLKAGRFAIKLTGDFVNDGTRTHNLYRIRFTI